jgi:hypothetical protein
MLSLMLRVGSFHKSMRASGGSKPRLAIKAPLDQVMSTTSAIRVAMSTHTAEAVILIRWSVMMSTA